MKPILPTSESLLGKSKEYISTARPRAAKHLDAGRWSAVLAGQMAQEQVALTRVAQEASCARVPTAEGHPLLELLQGEFDADIDESGTYAGGQIQLYRLSTSSVFPVGLIRKGTKVRRVGDATKSPPSREASFETLEDVFVGSSDGLSPIGGGWRQDVFVKIRATQQGTAGNVPQEINALSGLQFALADTLFDKSLKSAVLVAPLTIMWGEAAGGSDGPGKKLKSLGKYLYQGQYGPNLAAIAAGLLSTPGVSRIAISEDKVNGGVCAWLADDSWAYSARLGEIALQTLKTSWQGFGCKVSLGRVFDYPISVAATVVLRDKRFAGDTTAIMQSIRVAVREYFGERADWYTWTIDGLVNAICRSDRRILAIKRTGYEQAPVCEVRTKAGVAIPEPPRVLGTLTPLDYRYHWAVDATNIQILFETPKAT